MRDKLAEIIKREMSHYEPSNQICNVVSDAYLAIVVPGKTVQLCKKENNPDKCQDYFKGICWKCRCHKPRPATIKDLIT